MIEPVVNTITNAIQNTFKKYDSFKDQNRRNSAVGTGTIEDYYDDIAANNLGYGLDYNTYETVSDDYNSIYSDLYTTTTTRQPLIMPNYPYFQQTSPSRKHYTHNNNKVNYNYRPRTQDISALRDLRRMFTSSSKLVPSRIKRRRRKPPSRFKKRKSEKDYYINPHFSSSYTSQK